MINRATIMRCWQSLDDYSGLQAERFSSCDHWRRLSDRLWLGLYSARQCRMHELSIGGDFQELAGWKPLHTWRSYLVKTWYHGDLLTGFALPPPQSDECASSVSPLFKTSWYRPQVERIGRLIWRLTVWTMRSGVRKCFLRVTTTTTNFFHG